MENFIYLLDAIIENQFQIHTGILQHLIALIAKKKGG